MALTPGGRYRYAEGDTTTTEPAPTEPAPPPIAAPFVDTPPTKDHPIFGKDVVEPTPAPAPAPAA